MLRPGEIDNGQRAAALKAWAEATQPGVADVRIGAMGGADGAGFVNETLFVDATWSQHGQPARGRFVVRLCPSSYTVFHEAAEFFEPQYRLMDILARRTALPMPRMYAYEADPSWVGAPFMVMERVEGNPVPDIPPYFVSGWLKDSPPEAQARAWWSTVDVVAAINTVDWQALDLSFIEGRHAPGLLGRLDYWADAFQWASEGQHNPTVEAARAWLDANAPTDEPIVLSWGDARPGNVIYRDAVPAAVVDWEICSLGPPLQDLSWWFFVHRAYYGDLHTGEPDAPVGLPGFPSREATLQRYEQLTGYPTEAIDYHEIFAGYRMAIGLERMGRLFAQFGLVGPKSQWHRNNPATLALASLLGIPHPDPEPLPAVLTGA
jgi:aminoglycoside phosphotransferase (APT) family kinase protein